MVERLWRLALSLGCSVGCMMALAICFGVVERCQIHIHVSGRRRRAALSLVVAILHPSDALTVVQLCAVEASGLVAPIAIPIIIPLRADI
jgi:hypothetical protein